MSECPTGLAKAAAKRRAATCTRVAAAIEWLRKRDRPVSLRAITAADAALSDGHPPLAQSTILNNPEAYELYVQASPDRVRPRARRPRRRDKVLERKSKAELIDIIHETRTELAQLEQIARKLAFGSDLSD